jgi:hypothetical protein
MRVIKSAGFCVCSMTKGRFRDQRFSPGNPQEPWRRWKWKIDDDLGTAEPVPEERGWPPEGELITDATASLAISHRRGDIIARYLRQPTPSRHIVLRIAALFDWPKDGTEADRLYFVRRQKNHPMHRARLVRHRLQIGHEIAAMVKGGATLKQAVHAMESKYKVKRSSALSAYKLYKQSRA